MRNTIQGIPQCRIWVGVAVVITLASQSACDAIHPLGGDEICNEVGFSVASQTLECTGDSELANQRYEQFKKQLTCTVTKPELAPVDQYMQCAVAVNTMDCAASQPFGDDIVGLVSSASSQCSRIFEEIDGAVKPNNWEAPNNGMGTNPLYDQFPTALSLCPNPSQGTVVDVAIQNNRATAIAVLPVELPCKEGDLALVVEPGMSATYSAPVSAVFIIRSDEGAELSLAAVTEDLVVEVPP